MQLALFQPDIPQNTGALIRLAACMGVPLHIIEPCGYPFDDKRMRRTSMDYMDHAHLIRHMSWEKFLAQRHASLKGRLLLLSTRAQQSFVDFAYQPEDILLLGRESSGVPEAVVAAADARIKIPMQPGVRSLNVAQAASMVLGEALRQTNRFREGYCMSTQSMRKENASTLSKKQAAAIAWFRELRDQICAEFEKIEYEYTHEPRATNHESRFLCTPWTRDEGGGGEMSLMRGRVFEKVGVNISTVYGEFSDVMRKEIPGADADPRFWASGISLVAHMCSPLVPAVHMNTRMIVVGEGKKLWFGGGADLTPMYPDEKDTQDFHSAFKTTCDAFDPAYHPKFKAWCDEYFFLKHRGEPRGVGGIFYDYVNSGDWQKDFAFTQAVGKTFLDIYPRLVRRHRMEAWTPEQREHQLKKRGRYVEFNLLYDRGTKFGLMTGGNTEAILMSLPPEVKWP